MLVMESLEHAQARGANIICEYLGSAVSCDAHHMTDPRPDGRGVGMCIENALKDAGTYPCCLHTTECMCCACKMLRMACACCRAD